MSGTLDKSHRELMDAFKSLSEQQAIKESIPKQEAMDPRNVFVIYGRNTKAKDAMYRFLSSLDLHPWDFNDLLTIMGGGSPDVLSVVEKGFQIAQAFVVLMTPDDEARLQEHLCEDNDPPDEKVPTPQARPNVLFEAGMAMGKHPDRTVLVQFGNLRHISDISGKYVIRMDDSYTKRLQLATLLKNCRCSVNFNNDRWPKEGEFEAALKVELELGKKEDEERENWLRKNASPLIEDALKRWFEPRPAIQFIGGGLGYPMTIGSAEYKSHGKSKIVPPTEPQIRYIDEAIEYLREGYPNLWAMWEEAKKMTSDHFVKIVGVWNGIEERVLKEIGVACPLLVIWDARGQRPENYYILEYIIEAIYREVEWYRKTGEHLGLNKISPENALEVGDGTRYARSQDKAVLNKFLEITNTIIEDSSLLSQLESLDEERSEVEAKVERFRKALDKVIVESSRVTQVK